MTIGIVAASAGAWIWKNYGKAVTDAAVGAIKEKWEEFKWNEAAERYRLRIGELYGTLRVLGSPTPVSLEGIFTDVFILDRPTAFRRFNITRLRDDPLALTAGNKRISGLRLITLPGAHRLFVLGKPGAGKTTFLKYITLQAVEGKLDKIPIFVSLREWMGSGLDLLPFIARQFEICAFPDAERFIEEVLKAGQSIVLFDGLDEISQEGNQRARSVRALSDFSKQYHSSQCVITCRIAATDYVFEKFNYVEIADFVDEQVRVFVHRWFGDNCVKRDKFLEEVTKEENRGLRELGRIPLLLSLLCLAFDETMKFPQRRVEVYEEALDALLKKWDAARNIQRDEIYRKLSLGRKRQMLARIAAETFEQGDYFLHQDALEARIVDYLKRLPPTDMDEDIDGEAVLKAIEAQHGILVERAWRVYSFSHLTFQEYYTAKYIVDNAANGTLERLIQGHLTDDRWREVFLLTASLLDNADGFFTMFRRAIEGLISDDETLVRILQWAHRQATTADATLKPVAIRSLYFSIPLARRVARAFESIHIRERALNSASSLIATHHSTITYAREHDRLRAAEHDLGVHLRKARSPALAFAHAVSLTHALEPDVDHGRGHDSALDLALDLACRSCSPGTYAYFHAASLRNDVDRMIFLIQNDLAYQRALARTLVLERESGSNWSLSPKQWKKVTIYLKTNLLLTECLDMAYVSDRSGVEENLLLPPGI